MTTVREGEPPKHTGEPGHVWDHEPLRPRSRVFQEQRELEGKEKPREMRGRLACTECGTVWPGTEPCAGRAA